MKFTKNSPIACLFSICCLACSADQLQGTWDLYESLDYENLMIKPMRVQAATIQISKDSAIISPTCKTKIQKKTYSTNTLFQPLLKSGERKEDIDKFFMRHFELQPDETTTYYRADHSTSCNRLGNDIISAHNKLLFINGGIIFNVYVKSLPKTYATGTIPQPSLPENLKTTPLPFKSSDYMEKCADNLPKREGIPQPTLNCSPSFFPHLASRESKDFVSKAIGGHNYFSHGGRNGTADYDNPVSNGLHPLFLVFPPLGDVVLARVDDLERTESRDVTSTAYISIKNNKVIDQLNEGYDFNEEYVCSTSGHDRKYQLTRSGQFIELK